jgi:hypothetical protein
MAHSSGFVHDHEVVRWAASQLPNLPHIQEHLRSIADGLESHVNSAADALISLSEEAAQVAAKVQSDSD